MEDKLLEPALREYRQRFPKCQGRGCKRNGRDIHEVAGGPLRMAARSKRACIMHLCRDCHELVQCWSKVDQLALKLLADPEGYSLHQYNQLVKGHLETWKQHEVDRAIELLTLDEKQAT